MKAELNWPSHLNNQGPCYNTRNPTKGIERFSEWHHLPGEVEKVTTQEIPQRELKDLRIGRVYVCVSPRVTTQEIPQRELKEQLGAGYYRGVGRVAFNEIPQRELKAQGLVEVD